jgi:proteasome lid subunit RPN8/RPN11
MTSINKTIAIKHDLLKDFIRRVKKQYPKKAFGYFLSTAQYGVPEKVIIFNEDVRDEWKDTFENYGDYYVRNKDAGFLSTPEETYRIERAIKKQKLHKVGVFHSHQRHPAILSKVDVDLHPDKTLWHIIISLRNFDMPQIRAFSLAHSSLEELTIAQVQ